MGLRTPASPGANATRGSATTTTALTVLLVVLALLAASCGNAPTVLAMGDNPLAPLEEEPPSLEIVAEPETDVSPSALPSASVAASEVAEPVLGDAQLLSATTTSADASALTTWVATATDQVTHLVARESPGGNVIPFEFSVPNPHQFGGPQVLMVTNGSPEDEWVEVQLPIRPNGQTGWIDASLYEFSQTQVRAEVNLTERSVVVYDGTEVIAQTQAVIGSAATPTPLGTFFITAKRRNPASESYLGPWALALSAFSEVHETFSGGLPVIAIHGTNRPDQVGQSRSNGCLRIPNEVVTLLAELVPLGAPVIIEA